MKFDALRKAEFGKIGTAAQDWSDLVKKLDDWADYAKRVLVGRSNKARWTGDNAGVTRPFIEKTQREFDDLLAEARTIRDVLEDTERDLKRCQREMKDAIKAAEYDGYTVESWYQGGFRIKKGYGPTLTDAGKYYTPEELKEMESHEKAISKALREAAVIDSKTAQAMRAWIKQAEVGATGGKYADRDSMVKVYEAAGKASALAEKGADLNPKQVEALNKYLRRYGDDKLFAERFARETGADGVNKLWAGINDGRAGSEMAGIRPSEELKELQKNLGITLASATQSDSPGMQRWERELISNGGKTLELKDGVHSPRGFQIFSNLMRYGDYDDKFLKKYSSAVMKMERKGQEAGGLGLKTSWMDMPMTRLNHTNEDRGLDPMAGMMRAFSKSPDAATDFFHQPYEPAGDDGKGGQSNFDYLFKERPWEMVDGTADGVPGRNALGAALEAGATGHVAGEKPDSLVHTPGQARLMEDVVKAVSQEPTRLTDNLEMGDNMGRMTREYMGDIYRGLEGSESATVKKLFPVAGEPAVFGEAGEPESRAARFLIAVGQNPDGYKEVQIGQRDYAEAVLKQHLDPDIQAKLPDSARFESDSKDMDRTEDVVKRVTQQSGYVSGALTLGRQETLISEGLARDADYELKQTRVGTWGYGAGATVTGVALAAGKVNPVAGALTSGLTGSGLFIGPSEWNNADSPNEAGEKAKLTASYWSGAKDHDITLGNQMYNKAYGGEGFNDDNWDTWVRAGSKAGFNDAVGAGHQMATEMTSGDQVKKLTREG